MIMTWLFNMKYAGGDHIYHISVEQGLLSRPEHQCSHPPTFIGVHCYLQLSVQWIIVCSLFLFIQLLYCLPFNLQLLNKLLVSSNFFRFYGGPIQCIMRIFDMNRVFLFWIKYRYYTHKVTFNMTYSPPKPLHPNRIEYGDLTSSFISV